MHRRGNGGTGVGRGWALLVVGVGLILAAGGPAWGGTESLLEMDLRELTEMRVTSVSRRPQKLSETASAVFVITSEDIRRSGATSIPEALRMVPGLEVLRINTNTWAVTARGMNDRFSNKLLVLIDGRTVYTPLFSGVYWDVQDIPLEDIDRIEVIRGPGASVWGANAVNGIINIITKSARDTQGWLASATAGTEERGRALVRYGGKVGAGGFGRMYAQYTARDEGQETRGLEGDEDDSSSCRVGARVDLEGSPSDHWMLQVDAYRGRDGIAYQDSTQRIFGMEDVLEAPVVKDAVRTRGGWVLGRWRHTFPGLSELTVQAYLDRTVRDEPLLGEARDTFDLDLQHRVRLGSRHDVVWGLGFRTTRDRLDPTPVISFGDESSTERLWSGFVQDEVALVRDRVRLTVGAKVERNDYTGVEFQPTARVHASLGDGVSAWAAVSRAVRTPSRYEDDGNIWLGSFPPGALAVMSGGLLPPNRAPAPLVIQGSDEFDSEVLKAYEMGFRTLWRESVALDVAGFYNEYDRLRTFEPRIDPVNERMIYELDNLMDGSSYGVEVALDWFLLDWWRLYGAYTWERLDLRLRDGSADSFSENDEGRSPRHHVSLRSAMDLTSSLELDLWVRYVDRLPQDDVDAYTELDVRLGWRPWEGWSVDLVGQNLLHASHEEFVPGLAIQTAPTQVERGVYLRVTWQR